MFTEYLRAGNGHSSLLVLKAATDGDPGVDIVLQLTCEQKYENVVLCIVFTGEEAGRELVLDVAGGAQPDVGFQPLARIFKLKRVLSEPVELQLALLPWMVII